MEPMYDPDARDRELLSTTWRGVVQDRLESHGWWGEVSAFSSSPPHLYLRPEAPAESEGALSDLIGQGLVVERAVVTFDWLAENR